MPLLRPLYFFSSALQFVLQKCAGMAPLASPAALFDKVALRSKQDELTVEQILDEAVEKYIHVNIVLHSRLGGVPTDACRTSSTATTFRCLVVQVHGEGVAPEFRTALRSLSVSLRSRGCRCSYLQARSTQLPRSAHRPRRATY